MCFSASAGPVDGAANRLTKLFWIGIGQGGALVQTHGDVRSKVLLDADCPLGGQLKQGAVDVRAEDGGVIRDLQVGGEAEDLVASAVGQDGPMPVHETM